MRAFDFASSVVFKSIPVLILYSCASSEPVAINHNTPAPKVVALPAALSTGARSSPASQAAPATSKQTKLSEKDLTLNPTIGELSREWKLHPYEIREQAAALEAFLRYGRYPKNYCTRGKPKKPEAKRLCDQVSLIVASYHKNTPKKRPVARQLGFAKTGQKFRISAQNIAWAQRKHFDDVIDSITPMSSYEILELTPRIVQHQACPRNLSAAAIRKLENLLPSNDAKFGIEKLYAHAATCLKPNDSAYAITHMRQALLRLLWGDSTRARTAAALAPLGAKGEELPRALFWAGFLQPDATTRDQYWSRLVTDHPLSFHAINAQRQLKRDPLADASARPIVRPSRDSATRALSLSLRWFEALMLSGRETAASRMSFWISNNYRDEMNLGNIIYITHLKADRNTHQASFGFVWNQIEKTPEYMNEQTLKLMFPLPYWNTIKKHSGRNDPMLLMSVAKQESAFNPQARSPANARGLLQLLPATAHAMAGRHVNLYAPEINAQLGSKFLGQMIDKFDSVEMALAAYNAGPLRIPQWRKRYPAKSALLFMDLIPYRETRNYVANILRNNYWYSRLYEDAPFRGPAAQKRNQSALVKSLIRDTRDIRPEITTVAVNDVNPAPQAR